ncbi:hypothetical protein OBBRIDRAFT_798050 [Obba rivulosa]|uniref:Uncharacterized protein n=1 Tax=Obba rivulosa TaxID=1052685 RepID=A0A8E2ALH4_9APHY|nr:hypothetical protein OBBRIDRAFT_798050 [Obba rivulosa]
MTQHVFPPTGSGDSISNSELNKLKDSFRTLISDHRDIQQLFVSVQSKLEETGHIEQPLLEKWQKLRMTYNRLSSHSKRNAGKCATCLDEYIYTITPTALSSIRPRDKELMINNFLAATANRQEEAEQLSDDFENLAHNIETFQLKVANVFQEKDEATGAWENLCKDFKEFWKAVSDLVAKLLNSFRSFLSKLGVFQLSCFGKNIYFELPEYSKLPSDSGKIKMDCKNLADKLRGFKGAWHLVMLNCSNLRDNVKMAKQMDLSPAAANANLTRAANILAPLAQCLLSYSKGEEPQ